MEATSTEVVHFRATDGSRLAARLERPDGPIKAFALFAHCFTCTKNIRAAVNVSRALAEDGVAVLRFDFTGLGESEGDFADTNFSSNVDDLLAGARHLEKEWEAPGILVGHSLGGSAVLAAAARLPSVRAVATVGAPADPAHVLHHLDAAVPEIEERGEAEVLLAGRPFRVKRQFLEDVSRARLQETLGSLGRAVLIMHSPIDQIVGIENAAALYKAARHPKSFVSLDAADHLLTKDEDSRYAAAIVAVWASRYVDG